jgi:DNA-binding MarR family transcriptional regulator
MPSEQAPLSLLAAVRRSLRLLNDAIEDGAKGSGLTVQQQAFLLVTAARGGRKVPLREIRTELAMDQATASELLARLIRLGLVTRATASDRRAVDISLSARGRQRFARSLERIRDALQVAEGGGDLRALRESLAAYLDHYTGR